MCRTILGPTVCLYLHDPAADGTIGRIVDEPRPDQLGSQFDGRSIEPGPIQACRPIGRRRDHGSRRRAISSGTKGRARKPAVGMTVWRKKSTMSELFIAS